MNNESKSRLWIHKYSADERSPYDNKSQDLFLKEALSILDKAFEYYGILLPKFMLDDKSVEKAVCMLHLDALDTLRDCVFLLKEKKHRIVGKMFRDVTETLDLATLFWWERDSKKKHLEDWYADKVIPHREFRNYLLRTKKFYQTDISDDSYSKYSRAMYDNLSKWTHHCYSALLNSFSQTGDKKKTLVYNGHSESLILSETLLRYSLEIKELIIYFLGNIKMAKLIDWDEFREYINKRIYGIQFM